MRVAADFALDQARLVLDWRALWDLSYLPILAINFSVRSADRRNNRVALLFRVSGQWVVMTVRLFSCPRRVIQNLCRRLRQ
jgi:hypothetical protein